MEDQKWRTTASETVLKDRWIDVRADHCVTQGGVEISPYYVLSYPEWVHVVAITAAGDVVLVRQYRHAAGIFTLELPGGALDPADTHPSGALDPADTHPSGALDPADTQIEQAARRELEEETGFTSARWELITSLHPNPATHTNRMHFYLARDAVRTRAQRLDPGEDGLTVEIMPIQAVLDGLRSGLIGQAAHASGLILGLVVAGRLNLTAA
jgi:8-oxo-dGTP pyrophosphatase MutT (NUDIX family)